MKQLRVLLVCLGMLFGVSSAIADTRVALVIGNSRYREVGVLPNPQRDAVLVADTLKDEGFDVVLVEDATRAAMLQALNTFNDQADQADWALVYFAGHGLEIGGVDYLLPIDAQLKFDRDAQDEAVSLNRVLDTVVNARKMRLVILDACRNNPFATTMKRSVALRAVDRGLAPIQPQAGIMVVYAAAAGEVAEDGTGDHSPFTKALVNRLKEPGLEVSRLFNVVTADVLDATRHHQRPFEYGSNPSREEFFFKLPLPPEVSSPSSISDAKIWSYLKGSTDPKMLTDFHDGLSPDSPLRSAVEARLKEVLGNSVVAAPTPASTGLSPDEVAWSYIQGSTDAKILRKFLAQFPDSERRNEIWAKLASLEQLEPVAQSPTIADAPASNEATRPFADEAAWAQVAPSVFSADLRGFMERFPHSPLKHKAEQRLNELDETLWLETPRDDVAAQRHYLALFPDGLHKSQAQVLLASLEQLEPVAQSPTIADAPASNEATRPFADEAAWAQVAPSVFSADLRGFMERFPHSPLKHKAEQRLNELDETLWLETPRDDVAAQRHYLALFPDGLHKSQAQVLLASLEQLEPVASKRHIMTRERTVAVASVRHAALRPSPAPHPLIKAAAPAHESKCFRFREERYCP